MAFVATEKAMAVPAEMASLVHPGPVNGKSATKRYAHTGEGCVNKLLRLRYETGLHMSSHWFGPLVVHPRLGRASSFRKPSDLLIHLIRLIRDPRRCFVLCTCPALSERSLVSLFFTILIFYTCREPGASTPQTRTRLLAPKSTGAMCTCFPITRQLRAMRGSRPAASSRPDKRSAPTRVLIQKVCGGCWTGRMCRSSQGVLR